MKTNNHKKKTQPGKNRKQLNKNLTIDESVFEKLLGKAVRQLPFSPKKSGKAKHQTSAH